VHDRRPGRSTVLPATRAPIRFPPEGAARRGDIETESVRAQPPECGTRRVRGWVGGDYVHERCVRAPAGFVTLPMARVSSIRIGQGTRCDSGCSVPAVDGDQACAAAFDT